MASEQTLRAVITATNETGPVFAHISEGLEKLTAQARMVNRHMAAAFAPMAKIRAQGKELAEATGLVAIGEKAKEAGEHVRRLHEHVTDFLKPLGALTALASVGGIAEAIKSASEYGEHLQLMSAATGIGGQKLAGLEYAAKLANIPQEQIDRALQYENRQISEAARGKNKDVEAILARMGIANMPGHIASTATVLKAAEDESQRLIKTGQVQLASDMLSKLYGERQGAQLLPLFAQGSGHIGELQAEAVAHGLAPSREWIANAAAFQEQYKQLDSSVVGLSLSISGKLFPVLTPIIEDMSKWIDANREWIATNLAGAVQELADWLHAIDWRGIGADIKLVAADAKWAVNAVGGFGPALAIIAGLRFVPAIIAIGRVGVAAVASIGTITTALWAMGGAARVAVGATGIGLLLIAADEIYQHWDVIEPKLEHLFQSLGDAAAASANKAKEAWSWWNRSGADAVRGWIHQHAPWLEGGLGSAMLPSGPRPSAGPLSGSRSELARRLYDEARAQGLDRAHALAMLGNAYAESGLNAAAVGDHGTSFGLFQEHADRAKAMIQALGPRARDPIAQLDYAIAEQRRREPGWFITSDSVKNLTNDWERGFERPANVVDRGAFADRVASALNQPIRRAAGAPSQKGKIDVNVRVDHKNPPPGATASAAAQGSGDYEFGDLGAAFAGY